MKKLITSITFLVALATVPVQAQENLLAGKTVYPLGEAKTWSAGDESVTFKTEDLQKLVEEPANTSNIFLYPENGTINTEENQALGAQGFYIDMETLQDVGIVRTTWEGAAADAYDIYLTDVEPTPAILSTTPTFSESGLGQYTENTAVLPAGSKGRYLVFQVTKATNWGWGVKIRSISANAPQEDELSVFKISPTIVAGTEQTPVTLTALNQFGLEIPSENVGITTSDNAVLEDGNITVLSGNTATVTATLGGKSISCTIYVAQAPSVPAATSIKTPIYTNTVTDYNSTAEFVTAYNGGADSLGELVFADGEVAREFGNTRCVFFSNSETTGSWNGNINPAEEGYRNLYLDVFSGTDSQCTIEFESVENLEGGHTYPFSLTAGAWTTLKVDVAGATKLGNLSIRFAQSEMTDILLANIYFSPAYVEGDEQAPVLGDVTAEASMNSIELTFSATDDLNTEVYYSISDGTRNFTTSGASGETVTYTVTGLQPSTTYNITVTASDGLNVSDPAVLNVKTTGIPDAPAPTVEEENVAAVYSSHFGLTELPTFDSWGSTGIMSTAMTEEGHQVLQFSNYKEQWGGLVNLDMNVKGAEYLCIDIYGDATDGNLTIAPVWEGYQDTPNKTVEVKANQWNSYSIPVSEFGYDSYGPVVIQLALTGSTLSTFIVDNVFFTGTFVNEDEPGDEPGDNPGEDEPGDNPGGDEPGDNPGGDEPGDNPGGDEPGDNPGGDEPGDNPGGDEPGDNPGEDEPGDNPGGDSSVDAIDADSIVDVYSMQGVLVKANISLREALNQLQPGIYIMNGRKIIVK